MQRILKTFLLLIFPYALAAQTGEDFSRWNAIHQWDGHTSWEQYMTMSPAFMGPNALPVPDIQNGRLSDEIQVEQLAGYQFSTGDKTTDLFSRVYIPCLLYTSDAADERSSVDLGGRRIIKKKKIKIIRLRGSNKQNNMK